MGGGGAFGSAAWGTQDAWALTASRAPQDGLTPLHRVLNRNASRFESRALDRGHEDVARMLREAGAAEERIDKVRVLATRPF